MPLLMLMVGCVTDGVNVYVILIIFLLFDFIFHLTHNSTLETFFMHNTDEEIKVSLRDIGDMVDAINFEYVTVFLYF